ncbi:MAG: serine hydrolase domain-containing protein [Actinomycetaceae bacterium]|nr:serine hydrolase domain-containing protein [Actinomycetaceae bacterium]
MDIPFAHSYALFHRGKIVASGGDQRRIYSLASVTKLLTARSALIAVERGFTSLDAPVGPQGATLAHVLSHASGMHPEAIVAQVAPEKRRIYSNAGYELIGVHLEDATGTPFSRWVEEALIEPLGMSLTEVPGSPAHSGRSCIEDLLILAQEYLAPTLISPELAAAEAQPQFPELAGVVPGYGRQTPCLWGLGPEIRGEKSPHWTAPGASPETFGHFGVAGSFLWIDRGRDVAAAFLGEEPFGPWHQEHWAQFNQELLEQIPEIG